MGFLKLQNTYTVIISNVYNIPFNFHYFEYTVLDISQCCFIIHVKALIILPLMKVIKSSCLNKKFRKNAYHTTQG